LVSTTCPSTLAVNAGCAAVVKCAPTAVALRSGSLNVAGTVSAADSITCNGVNAISTPSTPTGLSATASGSSINLAWTQSTGTPTDYNVGRATVSGGPYTTIATVGLTPSFSDTGLAPGTYFYVVNAFNSAGTSANSSQASATIVAAVPVANVAPNLSFPTVPLGQNSGPLTATVTSAGSAPLVLASSNAVTISGANAADFAIQSSSNCFNSLSIPVGQSCGVVVLFTPTTTTLETASLVVASNDPNSPDSVSLTGSGGVTVSVSPTSLAFGRIFTSKQSTTQTVTFTNSSGSSISISDAITGGDSTQFAKTADACTGTLTDGSTCTVTVKFAPTSLGDKASSLVFTFTGAPGSPLSVPLTGTSASHKVRKGVIL
jgi:Cep192 domain 4